MTALPRRIFIAALSGWLLSSASAQTAVWIAPGNNSSNLTVNWLEHANWDTGLAPNGAGAIAVFARLTTSGFGNPVGGASPSINGSTVTLDELRFAAPGNGNTAFTPPLRIGDLIPARLVLQGAGLTVTGTASIEQGTNLSQVSIQPGSSLELFNNAQAGATGSGGLTIELNGNYIGTASAIALLRLTDHASLGRVSVISRAGTADLNTVLFQEDATAGTANIQLGEFGDVTFRDRSTAANATINANSITFREDSTAGTARLGGNPNFALPRVNFLDRSNAGNAVITLGKLGEVTFADDSDAGTATVAVGATAAAARVIIQGNARTSGLTITTAAGGRGRLDLSGANQDVELRGLTGLNDIDLGANSLRFGTAAGNPAASVAGVITGSGGLTWDRPAILTISNPNNTYTGVTRILHGTLTLDQGRTGETQISAGAALTGSGQIAGNLLNAGTVSPGASPGTITIQGNYTQSAGAGLVVEFASATSYDRLVVNGTATLAGTLTLSPLGGYVPVGSGTVDFLTAGARSGQFDAVNSLGGFGAALSTQLVYLPTGVSVQVTQKPFAGFAGGSPAAAALGAQLDATLGTATGDYRSLVAGLNTLDAAHLTSALEALAPDRYAVLPEQGFLTAAAQQAARDRHFAGLRAQSGRGFDVSFEASHRSADFAALAGLPAARATLDGGTAGGTWHNGASAFGVSLGQEKGDATLDAAGSRADLKSLTASVFFQYAPDRFFLNASAAFSRDDYDLRRRIVYSGADLTATAAPSGRRTDLALTAGYSWRHEAWSWTPQVGLLHSRWAVEDFTETRATGANLAFADWSVSSLRTRAGFAVSATGRAFAPRLAVFWLHEMKDDRAFPAKFSGAMGAAYAVPGRPADRDAVQAAVGFDWQLGHRTSLTATLAGIRGGDSRLSADLSAGFQWSF